jgi:hypothetical protein
MSALIMFNITFNGKLGKLPKTKFENTEVKKKLSLGALVHANEAC